MDRVVRTSSLAAALFILLTVCGVAALAYLIPAGMNERVWASFDPLLVEAGHDSPDMDRVLRTVAPGTVSPWSSTVEIQAFGALERVPVAQLRHRLDEVDPRFDPFLRELSEVFRAVDSRNESYTVYYLPRSDTVWSQYRRIREQLDGTRFWLVGWDPYPRVVLLVAALLILVATVSGIRRGWVYIVVAATAVVLASVGGGAGGFVRAHLIFAGWLVVFEHQRGWERELLSYGRKRAASYDIERWRLIFVTLVLTGLIASIVLDQEGRRWHHIASALILLGTCTTVSGLSLGIGAMRVRGNEHPLFSPVPIISGSVRTRSPNGTLIIMPFIALMMVVVPAAYYSLQARFDLPPGVVVPVPRRDEALPLPTAHHRPLGIESYLAHRAYQQALPFARPFAVPQLDEEVQLRRFIWEPSGLNEWFETVVHFDAQWFETVLDMRGQGTAYDLWLREGPARELVFESIKPLYWPSQMRRYAVLAMIVAAPLLAIRVERRKSRRLLLVLDRNR